MKPITANSRRHRKLNHVLTALEPIPFDDYK